jgi:hypothetical protein
MRKGCHKDPGPQLLAAGVRLRRGDPAEARYDVPVTVE